MRLNEARMNPRCTKDYHTKAEHESHIPRLGTFVHSMHKTGPTAALPEPQN